jgi:hypothetical protein
MAENNFKEGDIVISKNGTKPAIVTSTYWGKVYARYLHNANSCSFDSCNIQQYYGDTTTMTEQKQLYSFTKEDGTIGYGTHIGTNSANQYLIEEKGTGVIHVFAKTDLEEVLPYTFSVKMGNNVTHFLGEEGKVKKGDVLLYTGNSSQTFAVVNEVNTKNKTAAHKFVGCKLATEAL